MVLDPSPEGDGFTVTVPALPGCSTQGKSREAALERVQEAIACPQSHYTQKAAGSSLVSPTTHLTATKAACCTRPGPVYGRREGPVSRCSRGMTSSPNSRMVSSAASVAIPGHWTANHMNSTPNSRW